ncbi:hypothetical protein [Pelagibius marinus]|uniref:hypothetical protein n=1 Tax=Pelagibius marinus TaxID=2762760 RepID=UPI00187303C4|nr:hypothetical protein [Pelagibius marinus]
MRAAALLLGLFCWAAPALALEDVPGWGATRWGMTADELRAALGSRVTELPGRWVYGGAYAELAVEEVEIGGLTFTAYLQMNDRTERLQQVLLERRRTGAVPAAFEQVIDALTSRYGPPAEDCAQAKTGGQPLDYEVTWRFPTTILHAKFLDFSTTAVFSRDPEAELDPLVIERKVRRNLRRSMPRRILLRFHDAARADLDPSCA